MEAAVGGSPPCPVSVCDKTEKVVENTGFWAAEPSTSGSIDSAKQQVEDDE